MMERMKSFKLSIIIVHFNTTRLTAECLKSIQKFAPLFSWEVIVVDNGSEKNEEQLFCSSCENLTYIETGKNVGFAAGNNLAIQNSHGEYIFLLNSDTCLTENSFDIMLDFMDSHSEIGVLGCREVDGEGRFQLSCGHFPNLRTEMIRKMMHYRLSINDHKVRDYLDEKYASLKNVDWVSGSSMMLRRKALEDAGLLDERFFMYFEDIDLCRRIQDKGWEVRYLPATSICHYGGQSARYNLMHVLVEYRRSQAYFTRKYYGIMGSFSIRIFLFLKYALHALRWGGGYFFMLLSQKMRKKNYTMLLLAKKILGISLGRIPHEPRVMNLKAGARMSFDAYKNAETLRPGPEAHQ